MNQNFPSRFKRQNLHQRLNRARLKCAVFAMEPLVTLMATVLGTLYAWQNASAYSWPEWTGIMVMVIGLLAVLGLTVIGFTDPVSVADSVASDLEEYFHVEAIQDAGIRSQVTQAVSQRARLQELLHGSRNDVRADIATALLAVDEWLTGIGHLAQSLLPHQLEANRQSGAKFHLQARIAQLEARVVVATDSGIEAQLRETIAGRRHQQRAIEEMENLVDRGLLRLELAVAALGTVHSQLSMLTARTSQEASQSKLAQDISAEIEEIDAILVALDRVHSSDLTTLPPEAAEVS